MPRGCVEVDVGKRIARSFLLCVTRSVQSQYEMNEGEIALLFKLIYTLKFYHSFDKKGFAGTTRTRQPQSQT